MQVDIVKKLETLLDMNTVSANIKGTLEVASILFVIAGRDYTDQAAYLDHMATEHKIENKYAALRLAKLYKDRAKLMELMFDQIKKMNHD